MLQRLRAVAFASLIGFVFGASGADFKHENKPQNLKALFELVHNTVHVKKDNKQAVALFRSELLLQQFAYRVVAMHA